MTNQTTIAGLSLSLALALAATMTTAAEWPQWRGPAGDGVWPEEVVISELPEGTIPLRWRAAISSGYSGPTVADGRVFVMDRVAKPQQIERVHCFAWQTGERMWSTAAAFWGDPIEFCTSGTTLATRH